MSKLTLVSKDALYGALPYPDDAIEAEFYGKVLDAIDNLPIAYDINMVVEQMEDQKVKGFAELEPSNLWLNTGLQIAIEIVKGGINE